MLEERNESNFVVQRRNAKLAVLKWNVEEN